jgi:hypothetical protein
MAINYDLILKYLVKEEKEKESFTNQKNFMTYSDKFPNEFKNILGDKFYRMGVTQNNEQKNISFYTSLITLLDNNIMSITDKEEIHKVNEFLSDINNKIKVLPEYLKQIPKEVIKKNLKDKESNIWIYELIANYLKLNFIIFDFKTLEILTIYYGDVMDPWRTCLFLAKNENSWEPIRNNEKKFFSYNDNVLKKILSQNSINIKYFNNKIIKKDFAIFDNLEELVNDITKLEHSDDEKNTIFIKTETEIKMSEEKLNKMTKLELITHLKLLNKKPLSKATKKDLILLILKS